MCFLVDYKHCYKRDKMLRPISSLSLPTAMRMKLQESGFFYTEDLCDSKGVSSQEAMEIVKPWNVDLQAYIKKLTTVPTKCTAFDFWHKEDTSCKIISFCKELDDILDGGLPVRAITEICGSPGSGKTQLCLQYCVDVQIPKLLGGLEGEAVYISTDSGFTLGRLKDMVQGCLTHCQFVASQQNFKEDSALQSKIEGLSLESFLKGVHFVATYSVEQLIGAVQILPDLIHKNEKVKLIVVDSIAFPFRDGDINILERTGIIYRLLGDLESLAYRHSLAVVVTNQLTTSIGANQTSRLIPAMGDSFGHRVSHRLMLGEITRHRYGASVTKSCSRPNATAYFQITREGIRDCD